MSIRPKPPFLSETRQIAELHGRHATALPSRSHLAPAGTSVHRELAGKLLERLARRFDSMPCLGGNLDAWIGATSDFDQSRATLSAALTMICLDEAGGGVARPLTPLCVHSALTAWQLRLRGDGRPRHRRADQVPSMNASARLVVAILTETSRYQTASLFSDLKAHLIRIFDSQQRTALATIEAVTTSLQGALLFRDAPMIRAGRARLAGLLERHNSEGLTGHAPGRAAWDLTRFVDAVAPIYRSHSWCELKHPLATALRLLIHLVHPDGRMPLASRFSFGSCCSPLGPELLADSFADAATLAGHCRSQVQALIARGVGHLDDRQCSDWAPVLALAGLQPGVKHLGMEPVPSGHRGCCSLEKVGVETFGNDAYHAEVHGRCGGRLFVTWRAGAEALYDGGIQLVHGDRVRTPGPSRCTTRCSSAGTSSHIAGTFRRPTRGGRRLRVLLIGAQRMTRKLGAVRISQGLFGTPRMMQLRRRLSPDRYHRQIKFGDDWVRIRDVIYSRQRFDAVVFETSCATGSLADGHSPEGELYPVSLTAPGGCRIVITRIYRHGMLIEGPDVVDHPRRRRKRRRIQSKR